MRTLPAQRRDNRPQTPQAKIPVQSRRHDEIRAPALFRIGHLLLQNGGEPRLGHSGPPQDTLPLHHCRRGDDNHIVAARRTPALIEQRDIEHGNCFATSPGLRQKAPFGFGNHRMQNAFKPSQCLRITKYPFAEPFAVDPPILAAGAGKSGLDLGHSAAARCQQAMHDLVGIEQCHTHPPQHSRGGGLSHTDRTGQTNDNHPRGANVLTIAARSSGLTRTFAPNHASKPGRP